MYELTKDELEEMLSAIEAYAVATPEQRDAAGTFLSNTVLRILTGSIERKTA